MELTLIGSKSNCGAIGARVRSEAGGLVQIREVDGGNGYAGESTRRVHFGVGSASRIESLQIKWPRGATEMVVVPINRVSYIEEGHGAVPRGLGGPGLE